MTKQYREAYFPGTEELGPDEMRVTALGTGMPLLRPSQMSAGWLAELGNGDRFFFDMGTGCIKNFAALDIPYQDADKLFLSHLHSDHVGQHIARGRPIRVDTLLNRQRRGFRQRLGEGLRVREDQR